MKLNPRAVEHGFRYKSPVYKSGWVNSDYAFIVELGKMGWARVHVSSDGSCSVDSYGMDEKGELQDYGWTLPRGMHATVSCMFQRRGEGRLVGWVSHYIRTDGPALLTDAAKRHIVDTLMPLVDGWLTEERIAAARVYVAESDYINKVQEIERLQKKLAELQSAMLSAYEAQDSLKK